VVLWSPVTFEWPGGIQTYMRLLIRAASESTGLAHVLSLCDSSSLETAKQWESRFDFRFYGCSNSKIRFAVSAIVRARPDTYLLLGHLSLSPLAWLLKHMGWIEDYAVILHGVEAWDELSAPRYLGVRGAGTLLSTTKFTAEEAARNNNLDPDRFEILPLALEPERFDDVGDMEFRSIHEDDSLRVLGVGRVGGEERYKGFNHVVQTVAKSAERGKPVTFRHVGGGDAHREHVELAEELGVADRVEFRGKVSDSELQESFEWADVFAMPSKGEGFGLVYLEAMQYALPVVACPVRGAKHVVDDGVNGLFVDYGSPDELVKTFERLRDRELRKKLGQRGRRDVETRFSYERFRQDFEKIFRDFMDAPKVR